MWRDEVVPVADTALGVTLMVPTLEGGGSMIGTNRDNIVPGFCKIELDSVIAGQTAQSFK